MKHQTPQSLLPDLPTLVARLTQALEGDDSDGREVTILERKPARMMSTFPNEVVTLCPSDGPMRRVFIKYEAGRGHDAYGHRGGLAYEAEVYRQILRELPDFRPKPLGAHEGSSRGDTWLMLEYLDRCVRVHDLDVRRASRLPRAMVEAARWIGRFHAVHETRVNDPALSFLIRYDEDYFRGWASRASRFVRPLRERFPWIMNLCERCDEWITPLLAVRPSVIHGEFYTKNVLLRRRRIVPVDWESAAIAAGEIDLAALTEGRWPAKIVRQCERAYRQARWPRGATASFRRTLDAARVYLHFRWLGERPDWTLRKKSAWRFKDLRMVVGRAGLL